MEIDVLEYGDRKEGVGGDGGMYIYCNIDVIILFPLYRYILLYLSTYMPQQKLVPLVTDIVYASLYGIYGATYIELLLQTT